VLPGGRLNRLPVGCVSFMLLLISPAAAAGFGYCLCPPTFLGLATLLLAFARRTLRWRRVRQTQRCGGDRRLLCGRRFSASARYPLRRTLPPSFLPLAYGCGVPPGRRGRTWRRLAAGFSANSRVLFSCEGTGRGITVPFLAVAADATRHSGLPAFAARGAAPYQRTPFPHLATAGYYCMTHTLLARKGVALLDGDSTSA